MQASRRRIKIIRVLSPPRVYVYEYDENSSVGKKLGLNKHFVNKVIVLGIEVQLL